MKLTIANTSMPMLQHLHTLFNKGYIGKKIRRSLKHKPQWVWEVTTKNAEAVLQAIQPYLIAKREECRLALLSRTLINPHGNNRRNKNTDALDRLLIRLQKIKH